MDKKTQAGKRLGLVTLFETEPNWSSVIRIAEQLVKEGKVAEIIVSPSPSHKGEIGAVLVREHRAGNEETR